MQKIVIPIESFALLFQCDFNSVSFPPCFSPFASPPLSMSSLQEGIDFVIKSKERINIGVFLQSSLQDEKALDLENPIVKVSKLCTNDFQYLGQHSPAHESILLYWEEVAWLLEKRKLAFSSLHPSPNSVQSFFEWMMNAGAKSALSRNLSRYLVYCRLLSRGYVVWRPQVAYLRQQGGNATFLQEMHPKPDWVIFCPNARFSKNHLPPIDYLLWVVDDGQDDAKKQENSSCLPLELLERIANCNTKIAKLIAHVNAGNVNFISVDSSGVSLSESQASSSQPKKRKE